jgi:hypothetical protein
MGRGHANGVIIDTKKETVMRMEPNGSQEAVQMGDVDTVLNYGLDYICEVLFPTYKCLQFDDQVSCPAYLGPQYKQQHSTHGAGYCVAWSDYLLTTQMLNPDRSFDQLTHAVIERYDALGLRTLIRRFIDYEDQVVEMYRPDIWSVYTELEIERPNYPKFMSPEQREWIVHEDLYPADLYPTDIDALWEQAQTEHIEPTTQQMIDIDTLWEATEQKRYRKTAAAEEEQEQFMYHDPLDTLFQKQSLLNVPWVKDAKSYADAQCFNPMRVDYQRLGQSIKHAYFGGSTATLLLVLMQSLIRDSFPAGLSSWLHVEKPIGTGSIYGAIYSGAVNSVQNAVVLKMPRRVEHSKSLTQEAQIQTQLNLLRALVPNFALLLGTFNCPQLPLSGTLPAICTSPVGSQSPEVNYLVIEKVDTLPDGTTYTLKEFIEKEYTNPFTLANPTQRIHFVLSTLSQLLLALGIAQNALGFTHYDLHWNNILLQGNPQNRPVAIAYPLSRYYTEILESLLPHQPSAPSAILPNYFDVYVRSPYIAVMIDFGQSRTHKVHTFTWLPSAGVTDKFSPIYDAYWLVYQMNFIMSGGFGDKRLDGFFKKLDAQVVYRSETDHGRLGVDPNMNPELANGMTAMDVFFDLLREFPTEMRQVLSPPQPNDLKVPNPETQQEILGVCNQSVQL